MKSLYESIYTISKELNKISIEGIPGEIKDLKFTGDNANYALSIFHENLIINWNIFRGSNSSSGLCFIIS